MAVLFPRVDLPRWPATVGSIDALRGGHGLEQALRDVHGFSVQWERYRRFQYLAGAALMGVTGTDPTY